MTRKVEGRRKRSRWVIVLVTVGTLVFGVLAAGLAGSASAATSQGERVKGTPCSKRARACVDRAGHRAWLIKNGRIEVGPVAAAPGGRGRATPLGVFAVEWKDKNHRSAEFNNAPMPYAVFFAPGGIAFHAGNTGTPSAGCVRLSRQNAIRWYDSLRVGDRVEVR